MSYFLPLYLIKSVFLSALVFDLIVLLSALIFDQIVLLSALIFGQRVLQGGRHLVAEEARVLGDLALPGQGQHQALDVGQ